MRGADSVLHWDGEIWVSRQPRVGTLSDIWAAGPDNVWVAGDRLAHWEGLGWDPLQTPFEVGATPFKAVAGVGSDEVWAIAGAFLVTGSGRTLTKTLVTDVPITAMSVAGPSNTWVLIQDGSTSRILQVLGPGGNVGLSLEGPAGLNDLWVDADGTMWAAGSGGTLLRRNPGMLP